MTQALFYIHDSKSSLKKSKIRTPSFSIGVLDAAGGCRCLPKSLQKMGPGRWDSTLPTEAQHLQRLRRWRGRSQLKIGGTHMQATSWIVAIVGVWAIQWNCKVPFCQDVLVGRMGFQPDAAHESRLRRALENWGHFSSLHEAQLAIWRVTTTQRTTPVDEQLCTFAWTITRVPGSWNHLTRHDRISTGPRFFLRKLWITSFPGQRAIIRWMGYQFDVWHSWQEWRCELMTRLDKFQTWNLSFFRCILKLSWSMFTHVYTLAGTAATVWYSGRTEGRSPGKGSITVEVRSHDLRVCRLVEMHNYSSASWLFWWW